MNDQTFKEYIIQSTAAKRMMETVSPIYEDAYAGCWLFEDIGREWDRIWEIIDQLPDELFPQTATWMLDLWERRYGITPNEGDTIEVRRQRIMEIEAYPKPFTPWTLDRWCMITTARNAVVDDHIGDYTFGVTLISHPDSLPLDIQKVRKYINSHKHSHMSYELTFEARSRILLSIETAYWRFHYEMCGTKPYRNIVGGLDGREIIVSPAPHGYVFQYPFAGTDETGIIPQINVTSGGERRGILADASGSAYKNTYTPCGVINAGGGIL